MSISADMIRRGYKGEPVGTTAALLDKPVRLGERFHDAIVAHFNGIQVSGPAEERWRDDYFEGLLDALEEAGLRDTRRPAKKK
jgi:hypothetical protein